MIAHSLSETSASIFYVLGRNIAQTLKDFLNPVLLRDLAYKGFCRFGRKKLQIGHNHLAFAFGAADRGTAGAFAEFEDECALRTGERDHFVDGVSVGVSKIIAQKERYKR
jgi:hypothetical protein